MSLSDAYYLSFYLQMASYILPLWVGYRRFGYFNRILRVFFLALVIAFTIDLISWILVKLSIQDHYLDYFFSFNSFFSKLIIFHLFITNNKHRRIITGMGICIIPLFMVDLIWIAGAMHHNAFSGSIANAWILIVTIYCMGQLIRQHSETLSREPLFWLFLGISIKKTLTFADSLFSDYVLNNSVTLAYILYSFTYLVNVVENILYARGFQYTKK